MTKVRFIGFYDYTVILTYMSLVSAFLGILLANQGRLGWAVICLMASGICDAFDGTVARTKKNRTEDEKAFGIQLDSLCDVVSFGIAPAFLCFRLGMSGVIGAVILVCYCVCAVIRLAFFNVLEAKRQQTESGGNKCYRGLPVTTISIILPPVCWCRPLLTAAAFTLVLHFVMAAVAFAFVMDVPIRKPDLVKLFSKHK